MNPQTQTTNHDDAAVLNDALIAELKAKAYVVTPQVDAAFRAILRHFFVPDVPLAEAYANRAIPTKFRDGQSISSSSQPTIMAVMLE